MVAEQLRLLGGVGTTRQLLTAGASRHRIDQARLRGDIVRLRRGLFALPDAPRPLVEALRRGGVLAGTSAAAHHGLQVLDVGATVHVAVPRNWAHVVAGPGVEVHRTLRVGDHDDVATTPVRTVLDCARWLPRLEALVVADSARHLGVDREVLVSAAAHERGRGATRIREVVSLADPRAESVIETCLRLIVQGLGLTVDLQVSVEGVGRVDMVVEGWLVVEADGFAHHSDRASYRRDRRRLVQLAALGFTVLWFSYEDVVHRPDSVASQILAVRSRRERA